MKKTPQITRQLLVICIACAVMLTPPNACASYGDVEVAPSKQSDAIETDSPKEVTNAGINGGGVKEVTTITMSGVKVEPSKKEDSIKCNTAKQFYLDAIQKEPLKSMIDKLPNNIKLDGTTHYFDEINELQAGFAFFKMENVYGWSDENNDENMDGNKPSNAAFFVAFKMPNMPNTTNERAENEQTYVLWFDGDIKKPLAIISPTFEEGRIALYEHVKSVCKTYKGCRLQIYDYENDINLWNKKDDLKQYGDMPIGTCLWFVGQLPDELDNCDKPNFQPMMIAESDFGKDFWSVSMELNYERWNRIYCTVSKPDAPLALRADFKPKASSGKIFGEDLCDPFGEEELPILIVKNCSVERVQHRFGY